jgi:GDP-mannose 6-dehydrogenase
MTQTSARTMRVAVFGLGYVGTVTSAGLAARGHDVVGVDVDDLKVEMIRDGCSPVVEPGVEELIASGVASGLLRATTDPREALAGADVSLVCVGTPSGPQGETDLTYIARAVADIRSAMADVGPPPGGHHSVVVRSTVPPGTVQQVVGPVFEGELPGGWSVGTAMVPEFLREGTGVKDFFDPPFLVVGTDDEQTLEAMTDLFAFLDRPTRAVQVGTAEGLKYACNAFHAAKISFANEMGRVLRLHGVDAREVMEVFCEDDKLNISAAYLRPGFAFGGSCLPKDLRSLQHMSRRSGVDVPLLAGTLQTNELVIREVVERVIATGRRKVALLGLSFKSNTDDLRESPNVELAERLIGKGFDVQVYDPIINPERLVGTNRRHVEAKLPHLNRLLVSRPEEALSGAEVAIVAHAGQAVRDALVEVRPPHVIDLQGNLGAAVEQLPGYQGIGW